MPARQKARMTVDEFLAWAEGRKGRYELYNGVVYAMSPERAGHAEVKHAVATALASAIARAKLACWMLPDGMTVRVDKNTAHEPDALVYCGAKLASDAVEVPSPVIVVEVLSPSTRHIDASSKLAGYFKGAERPPLPHSRSREAPRHSAFTRRGRPYRHAHPQSWSARSLAPGNCAVGGAAFLSAQQ